MSLHTFGNWYEFQLQTEVQVEMLWMKKKNKITLSWKN